MEVGYQMEAEAVMVASVEEMRRGECHQWVPEVAMEILADPCSLAEDYPMELKASMEAPAEEMTVEGVKEVYSQLAPEVAVEMLVGPRHLVEGCQMGPKVASGALDDCLLMEVRSQLAEEGKMVEDQMEMSVALAPMALLRLEPVGSKRRRSARAETPEGKSRAERRRAGAPGGRFGQEFGGWGHGREVVESGGRQRHCGGGERTRWPAGIATGGESAIWTTSGGEGTGAGGGKVFESGRLRRNGEGQVGGQRIVQEGKAREKAPATSPEMYRE
ncbi:uncharacterized protein A4U43_C05F33360 [Asparagus officinalis]|uniref:Uncharacterized protein n=1 Tax=Asparagus officinalis TaxID=4686 RepID=A0A5P1EX27_ASPOF|nr:uncharacterized protein A4U43_C05F33360 [Asparagus officinalis]